MQMGIEFEDQNNLIIGNNPYNQEYGYITKLMFKFHFARTQKEANALMSIIAGLLFVVAVSIFVYVIIKSNTQTTVKYNISKEVFNKLPENIQIKILAQ